VLSQGRAKSIKPHSTTTVQLLTTVLTNKKQLMGAMARSSMINLITTFHLIGAIAALRSGRDVNASSIAIERGMETDYAADLRKFIKSEYWLGGVPPAECGRVPFPLHKSYWDCFHDKHLSLLASSSDGQGGGNTATPLLVEAPTDCNDTKTLEDLFCQSGNTAECLRGESNWGECKSCLMDNYTRQLYQRCSSEHGQPYETLTKVENIPTNPTTCANEDSTLSARVSDPFYLYLVFIALFPFFLTLFFSCLSGQSILQNFGWCRNFLR